MRIDTKQVFTVGIVAISIFAGIRWLRNPPEGSVEGTPKLTTVPQIKNAVSSDELNNTLPQKEASLKAPETLVEDPQRPGVTMNPRSEASKKEFLTTSRLSVNLPDDFTYQTLDVADGVTGLRGTDENSKINFAILAKQGVSNPNDVPQFLSDQGNLIPGFESGAAAASQMGAGRQLVPAEGSGVEQVHYWELKKGDQITQVVFANRKDGLGSYLFVIDGASKKVDAQEGRFEDMLAHLKAK